MAKIYVAVLTFSLVMVIEATQGEGEGEEGGGRRERGRGKLPREKVGNVKGCKSLILVSSRVFTMKHHYF